MAFLPTDIFASWSEDGTDITLPIASVLDLTAATADAATGDARQVAWSLAKTIYNWYNDLADKPEVLTVKYSPGTVQGAGDYEGEQKASITITAHIDFETNLVTAEVV